MNGIMKNLNLLYTKLILFIFLFIIFASDCYPQEYADSKGQDFWVTFMPNYHNNRRSSSNTLKYGDSLYLFIVAYEPTTGTIKYRNRNNNLFTHNFTITNIDQIYIFKVSYWDFELLGFNDSRQFNVPHQNEKVSPQYFHISSDKDITVYAHSQSVMTSDAFLVLPTDALGNEYFILTYNSDGSGTSTFVN